ncbi:ATP-binding protein [Occallatibacter savannae]|uniref:AAA family ATPase n=1 Tax=Occallatibacter savannae TaxID=1002691 RepID=UPI0013A5ABDE
MLRTAVLYGANGSGKSNLFKALRYVKEIALEARPKTRGTSRESFRLGTSGEDLSSFDLQFIAQSKLYRFGIKVDDNSVREEWLIRIEGSKELTLYERVTDDSGVVEVNVPITDPRGKLKALATVGGPLNQSFLATVHVTLEDPDLPDDLRNVLEWFESGLHLISPESSYAALGNRLATDEDFRRFAEEFLKASSTGVDRLSVIKRKLTEEELRSFIPESLYKRVLKDIAEDKDGIAVVRYGDDAELLIEQSETAQFFHISIKSVHANGDGKEVAFKLSDESDGTQRLLNLVPSLYYPRDSGAVYVIDEIDRSLHPIMVFDFLKFSLESCKGKPRQIIVTTHESNLLNQELLRRDEIWFAEKDSSSATRLYSLSDFKVRNDLEIRKHYLQGRFGAIPFLGNLNHLLEEERCSK